MDDFCLQFGADEIADFAARYSYADDSVPQQAGREAAERGHYDLNGFLTVCRWEAPRAERHFVLNSHEAG